MATRKPYILFIGFGHLAKSLLSKSLLKNYSIHFINSRQQIFSLKNKNKIKIKTNYNYVFLLVRPDIFKKIGYQFISYLDKKTIIISCIAGISINSLSKTLKSRNIVRIMPNIMAKNSLSQTLIFSKNKKILNRNFDNLIKSFGTSIYSHNEDHINIATAIYGSGPAFIAFIINSFLIAAKNISKNAKIKDADLIDLIKNVITINNNSKDLEKFLNSIASKKGTTQSGIKFLKSQNLKKIMYTTLDRAYKRAKEISVERKNFK